MQLAASMAPLARGRGVARPRERIFLLCALLTPLFFVALPGRLEFPAGLLTTALIILWLFRGRTLRLHGAEHRAIAAAEARSLETAWTGDARPSRFSPRCGTNFAALAIPVTALFDRVAPSIITPTVTGALVAVVSIGVTMELWKAVQHPVRPAQGPAAARPRTAAADDQGARARRHAGRAPGRRLGPAARALALRQEERHQDRVDVLAAAAVVVLAEALALEAELLVELDRRLVPGEDVQLELADAGLARPRDRLLEQRAADAAAAVARGDHQAEVGDVAARRVRIAGEREPPDDRAVVLGDEDGRVGWRLSARR